MRRRRFLLVLTSSLAAGTIFGLFRKGVAMTGIRGRRRPPVKALTRKEIYSDHDLAG